VRTEEEREKKAYLQFGESLQLCGPVVFLLIFYLRNIETQLGNRWESFEWRLGERGTPADEPSEMWKGNRCRRRHKFELANK
jgi:hypothetical protein